MRDKLKRICASALEWDAWVCLLQLTEANEKAMQLHALVSSADSPTRRLADSPLSWDLRCRMREGMVAFVQANYLESLPPLRAEPDPPPLPHSIDDRASGSEPCRVMQSRNRLS